MNLSHLDEKGRARMVDVSKKPPTARSATATGRVSLQPETLKRIRRKGIEKGDVLAVARVAGVMAAKQVPHLIPLCHPLALDGVEIRFEEEPSPDEEGRCGISIRATVKSTGPTGVEMEAMTAVCMAALTIYDMCKSVDRGICFGEIRLVSKSGGKSGSYRWKSGRRP